MDEASKFEWLKKPWMYTKPKNPEALNKWRQQWVNYILHYCEKEAIHVINLIDLKRRAPFNKLDEKSFDDIIKSLTNRKFAKFYRNNNTLRIYWKSLDEWIRYVWKKANDSGKKILKGKNDILNLEPKLMGIPENDVLYIINGLVRQGFARWIDKKTKTIKLVIKRENLERI